MKRLVSRSRIGWAFVAPKLASGEARRRSIPRSGAVTEEQRSQKPTAAQPTGRHVFSVRTSLFAPHPDVSGKGMLVTHASSEPKIHCRKCSPNT